MAKSKTHEWTFRARFRARAFGWRSGLAVKRVREAISEITRVARKDPILGAEGAVHFLERVSPAIEHVDSSSGSLGAAVRHAVAALVPLVARVPADDATRDAWLERLWDAFEADQIPYIESLADSWGELCAAPERASRWADRLLGPLAACWSEGRGYFKGTAACLSSLLAAGRHEELLALLERAPLAWWHYRRYGALALAAVGRTDEALEYAQAPLARGDDALDAAAVCERILLDAGRRDEAYERFAFRANAQGTNLATFRAIAKHYPERDRAALLDDLVRSSPGAEGRWFATARQLGRLELAADLARRSPCDPKTLNRAARDHLGSDPAFALKVALASLHWLNDGHGYEVTSADVHAAYNLATHAADALGKQAETRAWVLRMVGERKSFVRQVLGRSLELRRRDVLPAPDSPTRGHDGPAAEDQR